MSDKCPFPRKLFRSSPNSEDLNNFCKFILMPKFVSIISNKEDYYTNGVLSYTKARSEIIKFLQYLGSKYYNSDHVYVKQSLDVISNNPMFSFISKIIPSGSILNLMKSKESVDRLSKEIFTDRIAEDTESDYDAIDYFLHNAYGTALSAKKQLEQKLTNVVLDSFIINRKEGKIIHNINEALNNVEYYKKELFKEIKEYFKNIKPNSDLAKFDINTKDVKTLINKFKSDISSELQVGLITDIELQTLYNEAYDNNSNKAKLKLNAYGAWLALQHFDNFVKMSLGDTIIINPSSDEKRYSYSTKGTNVNTTWRQDDNIDLEAEVNKLTQALINTSPFIKFGFNEPTTNAYLKFSDFSYITAKVKDLVYNPKSSTFFIENESIIYESLSDSEKILVRNKSFRQLISNSRSNPQKYIPLIYKILVSRTNGGGYFIDNFGFNKQDKNILWSIYKNIYYSSDVKDTVNVKGFHSIYDIQRKDPNSSRNIFAAISSVSDCIFSVDFVQYMFDNGTLKLRTLRDAAVDKTRREIENIINTKNSSELIGNYDFSKYDIKLLNSKGIIDDDPDKLNGISFKLNLGTDEDPNILYVHVNNMGEDISFSKNKNPGKNSLSKSQLAVLFPDSESLTKTKLLEFFDEVLGLNLKSNIDFTNTFRELIKEKSANGTYDDRGPFVDQMLKLSSHVFFNRYFSQNYINPGDNKYEKLKTIRNYFSEDIRPKFNSTFFNMDMIPKKKYDTIKNLAQALGTTRGINSSRQVKDSDNSALSSQTLSRLLGNIVQQFDTQINAYNKLRELESKLEDIKFELENVHKYYVGKAVDSAKDELTIKIKKLEEDIKNLKNSSNLLDSIQNPAAAHFDLITDPNLFKGILKSEEIKGVYGNKKQVKFTTAEAVTSSFLHNFVLGHCNKNLLDKNSELGDNIVGLLPSVNSDKTTVSIAKFDLNAQVLTKQIEKDFKELTKWAIANDKINVPIDPKNNFEEFNKWILENDKKTSQLEKLLELVNEYNQNNPNNQIKLINNIHYKVDENSGNIKSVNRTYASLSNPEIMQVIQYEIGKFYDTMYNNIKNDFKKLSEFWGINIDPDTNFTEFHDYANSLNVRADEKLFELTNEYNKKFPNNPIRLIDQIHYITDKKTGNIKVNNTITSLRNRFSNDFNTKEFFDLKNTEILKSILDSGFEVMLYGNDSLDKQPEITYLRNYKNWSNDSGQMIIGKINIGNKTFNIANKNDLQKVEKELTINQLMIDENLSEKDALKKYELNPEFYKSKYGYDNLSLNIHKLTGKIELHPMLEKYNLMDYLFTQQLMYSSVGSHVAHPAKSKNKTDIIWAHPAIGKTYAVENNKYAHRIMDWDVEFNKRRDQWISNYTNVDINDKSFKTIREEFLINWNNYPEFKEFVTKEWNRIKTKANNENKILVASPHMLLEMFSQDFNSILTMSSDEFVKRNVNRNYTKKNSLLWKKGIDDTLNILQQNPIYANKIKLIDDNYYLSDLLENGYLQNELNLLIDNEMAEEASRFYAQHKRNVSFTAAMEQFQLNQVDGIPLWYNIAIIKDINQGLFTIDGNTNEAKPYDGATFVNPIIMYLENNSLNEARAGIDKKQFVHFYDEMTGSGGIIKTAGFAITNDRMRNSTFYRDMMKNMTNRVWKTYKGANYEADITRDYNGNTVDYGTFYFKKGNKYYKATIKKYSQESDPNNKLLYDDGSLNKNEIKSNAYIRTVTEISRDGGTIGEPESRIWNNVNTNYRLWEMFGGMNSQEFNGGILQPSETSLQLVTNAVIKTGEKKPGFVEGDITSEYIDQPLKNADIHYMPTEGAVKQGTANINPNTYYTGEHDLNFFKIRMTNAGIQLDKEHHANDSKLSLMTQVISSACSMGFNPKQAKGLYNALYHLTLQGIKPFKDSFKKLLKSPESPDFEKTIAECMIKNMLTSTAQDGDMLRAIAVELIQKLRKGEKLSAEDAKSLPYSDPSVFDKLVSNLSVIMTKSGIKAKMNGILSVLCPTQGIVKMYDFIDDEGVRHTLTLSQLEDKYDYLWDDTDTQETFLNKVFNEIQSNQPKLINDDTFDNTNITVGKKYIVKFEDKYDQNGRKIPGYTTVVDVTYPHDTGSIQGKNGEVIGYQALKNLLKFNHTVYGKVEYIQEYVRDGRDLNSLNYKFKGSDNKNYQIWDIDYIQKLYETIDEVNNLDTTEEKLQVYYNLISEFDGNLDKYNSSKFELFKLYQNKGENLSLEHELKLAIRYAKQIQQNILFSLSKNNPDKIDPVKIDNNLITIDKDSIQYDAYELVMPKIFLDEFGLENYANLNDILHNENYFYEKMVNNFHTKVLDETQYDIELKKTNGKHIYIKDKTDVQENWNQDLEKVIIYKKTDEQGNVWRYDLETNEKMYQLFDDSDEVYRVPGTDVEIIATSPKKVKIKEHDVLKSGITFYLDNFKYQSLHISEAIVAGSRQNSKQRPQFEDMLKTISYSHNKCARSWVSLFTGDTTKDVDSDKQGWKKDAVEFNKELNDFSKLGEKLQNFLKEQAKIMHTSLKKSLDVIAARIPAQNQQSFMPMKVVAFDNPNINTAYVSIMQFFLQGSDLDIDAVSLLTFSFSDSGIFYNWSSDFDMSSIEMLNLSMKLPFPTGKNLKIVNYETSDPYVNIADRKPLLTDNIYYKNLLEEEQRKENLTPEIIDPEAEKIYAKQSLENYIKLLEYINENEDTIYVDSTENLNSDFTQNLINRINKHNNYLKNSNDKAILGAIKNYVVGSLYSISSDAANLLEAHTGVDVATGPLKAIANASELSKVQKTFTPGNVTNKFQAIEEASVGKDDIAICATGLKGFFAATQFCNDYLNKNLQDGDLNKINEISKIVTFNPITIGGKTFNSLANIRIDDINKFGDDSKIKQSEIYQILKNKGFEEDASVIMSALLSLSTDNAKELCLAKINAGTGMIGMYLYGAAIGMDFDVMNKIIASPLGFTVAKLLNSNEFTLKKGKNSVDAALTYLTEGPTKSDLRKFNANMTISKNSISTYSIFEECIKEFFNEEGHEDLKDIINEVNTNKDKIISIRNIGKILTKLTHKYGKNASYEFLNIINDKVNNKFKSYKKATKNKNKVKNLNALSNQMNDYLNEFIEQTYTLVNANYETEYGQSNIVEDLNKLALGADEFKRLGQFLRLNQEIKTKSDELITFIQNIENCITSRIGVIKKYNRRMGISNKDLDDLESFDFKLFAESFINNDPDDTYWKDQVELYEKYCKTCINPLRILTSVDHYKGYLESMILAYEGDYTKSVKFRAIKHLGNNFITYANISNSNEKKTVYKGVKNFVDDYINNTYLKSQPLLKLPKSSEQNPVFYINQNNEIKENTNSNTELQLGTEYDNKTFEYFFETTFINALKNSKFRGNKFVRDLSDQLVIDPVSGTRYLVKSLPINMMPSSDNEQILFNDYKNEFNKLETETLTINKNEYSIVQMFQYYNLLKFRGKSGKSSLLKIFEDITASNEYLKSYRTFINNFDETYDFVEEGFEQNIDSKKQLIKIDSFSLYKYLAPDSNPYSASSNIIKYKDSVLGQTVLLERKPEESDNNNNNFTEDGYIDDIFEEQENYDEQDYDNDEVEGIMDDEDVIPDSYKPNYGDFKLMDEGVLTRFNIPVLDIDNPNEKIINNYSTNDTFVQNIIIKNGKVKQLIYNGERIDVKSNKTVVEISTEQNGESKYIINKDALDSIIETSKCKK